MEKKVYCSPGALLGLTRMIEHPLRMVKDLAEREVLCKRFYNELVSALNQIDRRTMTSVFYDLCKNSLALSDAQASVQRSYSDQSKSVKRERELSPPPRVRTPDLSLSPMRRRRSSNLVSGLSSRSRFTDLLWRSIWLSADTSSL